VALLAAYYVSGTALLALSSLAERSARAERSPSSGRARLGDERSLRFTGGLAEGTETIAVYVLLFVLPGSAAVIAWGFTAAVAVTAIQRIAFGLRLLRAPVAAETRETAEETADV
jgi:hypothetical protein